MALAGLRRNDLDHLTSGRALQQKTVRGVSIGGNLLVAVFRIVHLPILILQRVREFVSQDDVVHGAGKILDFLLRRLHAVGERGSKRGNVHRLRIAVVQTSHLINHIIGIDRF